MIINTLSPFLLKIGFIEIRWYSLIYLFGFLFTWWWLNRLVKRGELNVSFKATEEFIFWAIIGVIIGARVFEVVVWNPSWYIQNPQYIFAVWRGGLSFHGGFVGLMVAAYYWCKKYKVTVLKMFDMVAVPATLALALGRVGNMFNHELYGPITNVPWCVVFNTAEGCRHPAQLYDGLGRLVSFFVLLGLFYSKKWKDGFIFWIFVLLLGLARFVADFWRLDERWLALSTGQWLSAIMILVSMIVLVKYYMKDLFSSPSVVEK